jgi:hypothetical protein
MDDMGFMASMKVEMAGSQKGGIPVCFVHRLHIVHIVHAVHAAIAV